MTSYYQAPGLWSLRAVGSGRRTNRDLVLDFPRQRKHRFLRYAESIRLWHGAAVVPTRLADPNNQPVRRGRCPLAGQGYDSGARVELGPAFLDDVAAAAGGAAAVLWRVFGAPGFPPLSKRVRFSPLSTAAAP